MKAAGEPGALKRKLETQKVQVECDVFGNVRMYGFEYLGN